MMKTRQATRGFSLVEVVLALGVAAFCLLAIFGLLPIGVNSNQTSIQQTAAASLASLIVIDLQAIPKGSATTYTSPRYKVPAPPVPGTGTATHTFFLREDGTATSLPDVDASVADAPRYRVTINYNVPAANQSYFAVPTRIQITWPAMVDPTAATAPTKFSGSFEINSSLVRN